MCQLWYNGCTLRGSTAKNLPVREFLALLVEEVRALLPEEGRSFQTYSRWSLVKLYYTSLAVHYEAWVQRKTGRLELGLHFEGAAESNQALLAALARYAPVIMAELGPQVEMEQWTKSWTRIHRSLALGPLNEEFVHVAAQQLAQMITVLQPMLEKAWLEPKLS